MVEESGRQTTLNRGYDVFVNITRHGEECLSESGVRQGLVLVNAMHITASEVGKYWAVSRDLCGSYIRFPLSSLRQSTLSALHTLHWLQERSNCECPYPGQ